MAGLFGGKDRQRTQIGKIGEFGGGAEVYSVEDPNNEKGSTGVIRATVGDYIKGVGAAAFVTAGQYTDKIPLLRRFVPPLPKIREEAFREVASPVLSWDDQVERTLTRIVRRRSPESLEQIAERVVGGEKEFGERYLLPSREQAATQPHVAPTREEERKADEYNAIRSAGENADHWLAQQREAEEEALLQRAGGMVVDKLDLRDLTALFDGRELIDPSNGQPRQNADGGSARGVIVLDTRPNKITFPYLALGARDALGTKQKEGAVNGVGAQEIDSDTLMGVQVFIDPTGTVGVNKGGELRELGPIDQIGIRQIQANAFQAAKKMRKGEVLPIPVVAGVLRGLGKVVDWVMGERDIVTPGAVELYNAMGGVPPQRIPTVSVEAAEKAWESGTNAFFDVYARVSSIRDRGHALLPSGDLIQRTKEAYQGGLHEITRSNMVKGLAAKNRGESGEIDCPHCGSPRSGGGGKCPNCGGPPDGVGNGPGNGGLSRNSSRGVSGEQQSGSLRQRQGLVPPTRKLSQEERAMSSFLWTVGFLSASKRRRREILNKTGSPGLSADRALKGARDAFDRSDEKLKRVWRKKLRAQGKADVYRRVVIVAKT